MSEKGLEPEIEAALVQCRRSAISGHCPFVDSFCSIGDRRAISSHSSGGVIIRSKDYWGIETIVAIRPVAAEVQDDSSLCWTSISPTGERTGTN